MCCDRSQADKDRRRYTWRDLTFTAAELQHMTDKDFAAQARRFKRISQIILWQEREDRGLECESEAEAAWRLDKK
jgi:hypothetical protein